MRPDSSATFVVFSAEQQLGSETADSSGSARFSFTLPSNLAVGSHTIEARGVDTNGNTRVLGAQFEVVAAQPVGEEEDSLPGTGLPIGLSAMVAWTLVMIGLALTAASAMSRPRSFAVYWQVDPFDAVAQGGSVDEQRY